MKRKTVLAAGLVAVLIGAAAIPALSHGTGQGWGDMGWSGQGYGPGMMMGHDGDEGGRGYGAMEPRNGGGMFGGRGGMMGYGGQHGGMMGHDDEHQGFGPMRGQGVMGEEFQKFDANGDGALSPDEFRAGLTGQLTQYDKNGDGSLSIDEYSALFADITRPGMVRHFQALDSDGDGQVTAAEITAPADRMEQMQKVWQSRQGDGPARHGPAMMDEDN